ncbi:MAG TPA: long-chain fatty acid--CoA ligase, partial [Chloroflexi bacterium]|nr:long-chain fatty acid--CoA ligase [Chloroflexota bacterium]
MNEPQTIPQHFWQKAQKYGDTKTAVRQKELGIWKGYTWQESYEQVKHFGLGLIALGLQRGEQVASIGDNDRQYLWAFLAVQAVGGVNVGLYTDAIPKEIEYIVNHCDATLALAKDQEQCDKFLELKDQLPKVKKVIYWDERGLWDYEDDWLISFEDVQALGRELAQKETDRFETEVALGQADDLGMICYTSGTTGAPKGVMLSHGNMLAVGHMAFTVDPRYDTDNHVSFMPMGWIAEPIFGIVAHVMTGMIMDFPEEPETVRENVREIAPENLLYGARLWDSMLGGIQVRINDSTWLNRKLYDAFLPIGYEMAEKKFRGEPAGTGLKIKYKLGDRLVFQPLRAQLGMSRIRSAYTAGAVLSPDHLRFYHAIGVNLKQIYGSTEVTGGVTVHRDGDIKVASVGKPYPGVEMKTTEDGELLISGPTVMQGYYKNPEATAKDIFVDDDGRRWFRTGDAGYIDEDGHVIFQDRVKNMIKLANGEVFSPQFIEGRLKFSPYIRDVMAVGGETRDFVTALIIMDFDNVGRWAEKRGIGYTTFVDLS